MSTKIAIGGEEVEPLWTVHEVAAYLRKSVSWVRQASAAGRIPTLRIGGAVRFDPAEIRAWATGKPAPVIPMRR